MIRALLERPGAAAFHEVVRLLEALAQRDDGVAIGHQGPPSREMVRLRPVLDLSFGASEVDAIEYDAESGRYTVDSRFFSLYGTPSPLPAHYTERLLYDDPDGRLRAFLDIFNHRLLSLRHRAWLKYRLHAQYDSRGTDVLSRRMRILGHLERPGEPLAMLAFAGLLNQQPLSEASFEQILNTAMQVPIQVQSCHVRWVTLPPHLRGQLGRSNCALGQQCTLGDSARTAASAFRVVVGPLTPKFFLSFLPGGRRRQALIELIDRLNHDLLDCEIAIEVAPDAIEPAWLGQHGQGLGWNTWLGEQAPELAPLFGDNVSRTLHSPCTATQVA
ncbi:MAG: type VI secretion system baseplate subunit TssG [Planctomycetota bacterium]